MHKLEHFALPRLILEYESDNRLYLLSALEGDSSNESKQGKPQAPLNKSLHHWVRPHRSDFKELNRQTAEKTANGENVTTFARKRTFNSQKGFFSSTASPRDNIMGCNASENDTAASSTNRTNMQANKLMMLRRGVTNNFSAKDFNRLQIVDPTFNASRQKK